MLCPYLTILLIKLGFFVEVYLLKTVNHSVKIQNTCSLLIAKLMSEGQVTLKWIFTELCPLLVKMFIVVSMNEKSGGHCLQTALVLSFVEGLNNETVCLFTYNLLVKIFCLYLLNLLFLFHFKHFACVF